MSEGAIFNTALEISRQITESCSTEDECAVLLSVVKQLLETRWSIQKQS